MLKWFTLDQPSVCFVFPPSDASTLNEPVLQGQVEKLNRQNTEHFHGKAEADNKWSDDRGSETRRQEPAELILDEPDSSVSDKTEKTTREGEEEDDKDIFEDSDSEEEAEKEGEVEDGKKKHNKEKEESSKSETSQSVKEDFCKTSLLPQERYFFLFTFISYMLQDSKQLSVRREKHRTGSNQKCSFLVIFPFPL